MNPFFPAFTPWRPVETTGDVTNHAPISPVPTDEEPTSTDSSGISQHSGKLSSQAREVRAHLDPGSNITSPGSQRSSPHPSGKPSSVGPDRTDRMPSSYGSGIGGTSEYWQSRIDEIAEVIQLVISSPGSDRTPALGSYGWAFTLEGGHHRTSGIVWLPSHSPDVI